MTTVPVAVVGGSGFAGAELLRILAGHPRFEVRVTTGETQAGTPVADLYPGLAPVYGGVTYRSLEPGVLDGCAVVFSALPHGASQDHIDLLAADGRVVVDLGADFRLRDPDAYPRWYGGPHRRADLLGRFVYGLPERHRPELVGATAVAVPGCYPTAAILALGPFVDAAVIATDGIIVDAASGVSGAGRTLKHATQFCTVDGDFAAYGLTGHRHTPEMEQELGATVLFTPHLAPMTRGILATCYARLTEPLDTGGALELLGDAYEGEPFVVVSERSPSTKATLGTNTAHLSAVVDDRTRTLIVLAAIDNLGKGAAGQAVQCANIALGIEEITGLARAGVTP